MKGRIIWKLFNTVTLRQRNLKRELQNGLKEMAHKTVNARIRKKCYWPGPKGMRFGVISMRTMASQRIREILQKKRKKNSVTGDGTQENTPMPLSSRIHHSETSPTNVPDVGKASIIVLICVFTRGPTQEKNLINAPSVGNALVTALTWFSIWEHTRERSRTSVENVGKASAILPILLSMRGLTQERNPISVPSVVRVSAAALTLFSITDHTQVKSHMNVLSVRNASATVTF